MLYNNKLRSDVGVRTPPCGEKKMPFTHYVVYGHAKKQKTQEEAKKAWSEFEEALKDHNLKLKFWGSPWGVPEGNVYILKGSYGDYEGFIGSDAWQKCPIERTRTISLYKPPWAS